MPLCHLENSCSGQAACSAGLISIGNLLTFVQLYIIDNGRALPRKAQLVVYPGLSVLLCSCCLPHQHPEARAAASHTPRGAGAASRIPNSTLGAAELGMWIAAEPGIGLSFQGYTDKLVETQAFRAIPMSLWNLISVQAEQKQLNYSCQNFP